MMRFNALRPSAAVAATAMAFLSACSADRTMGPVVNSAPAISALVVSAATVIVPGTPPGSFTGFRADNSIRGETEFWDNLSADVSSAPNSVNACNIGFYAAGSISNTCINQSDGSYANRGSYTKYFGDGPRSNDATAFSFASGFTYTATLKGSYAGGASEVGYYTLVDGAYTWTKVPEWSSKSINHTEIITTAGTWGFYITNLSLSQTGGCNGTKYYCTAANGGFAATPYQQFALFTNARETSFLVGAEDNLLELFPGAPNYRDSDYNDFIWSVTAVPSASRICDFMTFGRTQITTLAGDVVISGNAGGNSPQGGILGNFLVKIGDAQYNLQEIESYGLIPADQLFGNLTNARVIVGRTSDNTLVEIRIYDGGEPGSGDDQVYVKIGTGQSATTPLGASGTSLNRGNIQFHAQCRGPR